MCPDTVRHDDPATSCSVVIEGHPSRPAWFGWTCILVAPLLGLQLHPNHADGLLGHSLQRGRVSPMCPVKGVTHVPGCTVLCANGRARVVRDALRFTTMDCVLQWQSSFWIERDAGGA